MAKDGSYLDGLLSGYKQVSVGGSALPKRAVLNLLGTSAVDNPVTGSTDVVVGKPTYVDIASFGADPTGVNNSTDQIMAAYTALAANGTLFGVGNFKCNSTAGNPNGVIFSTQPVRVLGSHGVSNTQSTSPWTTAATRFFTTENHPVLSFLNAGTTFGSTCEHIGVYGTRSGSSQHGILIDNGITDLDHVECMGCGGDGVRVRFSIASKWDRVVSNFNVGRGFNFDSIGSAHASADIAINEFSHLISVANDKDGGRFAWGGTAGGFNDNRLTWGDFETNGKSVGWTTNMSGGNGSLVLVTQDASGVVGGQVTISGVVGGGAFGGVVGSGGVNGTWQVSYVDDNTYALVGSDAGPNAVTGNYISGGLAKYTPSGVFPPTAAGISAVTNASPIVVTQNAHPFANLDVIYIGGVVGNTAANNIWTIHYIDANTYALFNADGTASTGNGAYTPNTGTVAIGCGVLMDGNGAVGGGVKRNNFEWKDERNIVSFRAHSSLVLNNKGWMSRFTSLPPSYLQPYQGNAIDWVNLHNGTNRSPRSHCMQVIRTGGGLDSGDNDVGVFRSFDDSNDGSWRMRSLSLTLGEVLGPDVRSNSASVKVPVETDALQVEFGWGLSSQKAGGAPGAGSFHLIAGDSHNAVALGETGADTNTYGVLMAKSGLGYRGTNVTSATYTTDTSGYSDGLLAVNRNGPVAITLATPLSYNVWRVIIVKDTGGFAGANTITLTPAAGTIDGAPTKTITTNFGVLHAAWDGTNWFTF